MHGTEQITWHHKNSSAAISALCDRLIQQTHSNDISKVDVCSYQIKTRYAIGTEHSEVLLFGTDIGQLKLELEEALVDAGHSHVTVSIAC